MGTRKPKDITVFPSCNRRLSLPISRVLFILWSDVLHTRLCDTSCQWLVTGRWYSCFLLKYTDSQDITEILWKVALNTHNHDIIYSCQCYSLLIIFAGFVFWRWCDKMDVVKLLYNLSLCIFCWTFVVIYTFFYFSLLS